MVMVYCMVLETDDNFENQGHVITYSKNTLVFHKSMKHTSNVSSRTVARLIRYPSLKRQHNKLLRVQVTLSSSCFFLISCGLCP